MKTPNQDPIDFSGVPRLEPRPGSFEQMLARRESRKPQATPRAHWPLAAAALLVLGIGFTTWQFQQEPSSVPVVATIMPTHSSPSDSVSTPLTESLQWFEELGSGTASQPLMVADALFAAF